MIFPVNLQNLKKTVDERQVLLTQAKVQYKTALKNLEKISDEIHQRRRSSVFGPRGCGVGSEDGGVQGAELQLDSRNKLEEEEEEDDAISSKTFTCFTSSFSFTFFSSLTSSEPLHHTSYPLPPYPRDLLLIVLIDLLHFLHSHLILTLLDLLLKLLLILLLSFITRTH